MSEHIARWLATAGAVTTGTAVTIYSPLTTAITLGVALSLITALALIAALARRKSRREAARKILKLLLDFLRPQRSP
jgi:hypothetical protein